MWPRCVGISGSLSRVVLSIADAEKHRCAYKRPADVVSNAVHVIKIANREIEESGTTEDGQNRAAIGLGR